MKPSIRARTPVQWGLSALMVSVLALSGCVTNTEGDIPTGEGLDITGTKDETIAALVPQVIRDRGTLIDGVNPPYAPNEFKDPSGTIVGFDVDLLNAVGDVLGLKIDYREADFDKIIPSIKAGTFDMGSSSFTVNSERIKSVDFVTYFKAGSQWAAPESKDVDPENACGLKVAVQRTTVQDTDEIPARSQKCVDEGKPPIEKLAFESQDEATNALILGRVNAFTADSPVTAYAIKRVGQRIQAVGPMFDSAPYGWPIAKGSPLAKPLMAALATLIADGTYQNIAEKWGVESGLVTEPKLNDLKG